LSATPDVARVAVGQTTSVPVTVLDSRQLSLGTGFLVETAAGEAQRGASLAQILSKQEDQISRTHVFAALATLEYLRRSGRMNTPMAGIGSLLQVKPIRKMTDGHPISERVRTTKGAEKRLLELFHERLSPWSGSPWSTPTPTRRHALCWLGWRSICHPERCHPSTSPRWLVLTSVRARSDSHRSTAQRPENHLL
jgi:fatty acid-binding protein DegV